MTKPAREKIALLLNGGETGRFSTSASTPAAGVTLAVEGVGSVRLPVGAPEERKLVSVARPARFGLGEETLTDLSVRDTWELTADQVSLGGEWEQRLEAALVEVHENLGLPRDARLRAELHALLVYGPEQFFAPHQDSEKDDEMVATLVVSLPSVHTGGELVVSHGGESRSYRHPDRHTIGFVAFYADSLHEVRPVRTGRRVTLTFNLLVSRDPAAVEVDPDDELAGLLAEHFGTPVTRRWLEQKSPPPNRLIVLLDHQYSQRGLSAGRLKGRDVEWVTRLRAAAEHAGCVTALALAEIRQTWSAHEDFRPWRHGYDDEDADPDDVDDEAPAYAVDELLDDEISLGWWRRAGTGGGEQISLRVDESEVCAVTPTATLTPHESEYEGYMGNYGNTLDRWYRRAALVVWPTDRDFIARAEADLPGAVAELDARLAGGEDRDRSRADARGLVSLLGGTTSLLAPLLPVADALDDAELGYDLLAQLSGEGLTADCAVALASLDARYGGAWTRTLIEAWFAPGRSRGGGWTWASGILPELAVALRQAGAGGVVAQLCRRVWANLAISIEAGLRSGPRARAATMAAVLPATESVVTAADASVVEEIVAALSAYGDGVLDLELPLLRRLGADSPSSLVGDAVRRTENLLAVPARAADDWSIAWTGCGCDLCDTLQQFLADRSATELDWRLRTDRRRHVHGAIDTAELPVTHRTIRKGSPYTLHLTKQRDLHTRDGQRRRQATADLGWLRQI